MHILYYSLTDKGIITLYKEGEDYRVYLHLMENTTFNQSLIKATGAERKLFDNKEMARLQKKLNSTVPSELKNILPQNTLLFQECLDVMKELDHGVRSFIAGMDDSKEQFPGHSRAYLNQVALPRAIEATEKYKKIIQKV